MNMNYIEIVKDEKKDIVIGEFGAVVCNYAQPTGTPRHKWPKLFMHFDHTHGVMNQGYNFAHDDDCRPDNIGRFRFCYSPCYEAAVKALKPKTPEELEENMIALRKRGDKLCLGRYVEQWFDVNEKQMIERYTEKCGEILDDLEVIFKDYSQLKRKTMDIRGKSPFNTDKMSTNYKPQLDSELDEILNNLDTCFTAINELSGTILIIDENFIQPQSVLIGITSNLEDIGTIMQGLEQKLCYYDNSTKTKLKISDIQKSLQDVHEKLQTASEELKKWKDEPYHFLTLNSYMVCRCGGLLSFDEAGQTYHEVLDRIAQNTENLVNFIEQECNAWYESYLEWNLNYNFASELKKEQEQEIKESKQAIEKARDLKNSIDVNPELETVDDIYNGIHIELWSHAYYDELKTQAIGILSLLTAVVRGGTFWSMAVNFYKWCDEGITGRRTTFPDLVDASSFYVPFITFKPAVTGLTILSIITTVPSLFYTSNATWVEEIRITFFTDNYAIIGSQKIDEYGRETQKPEFKKMPRFEYFNCHESNGLKWKLNGEAGIKYEAYVSNG